MLQKEMSALAVQRPTVVGGNQDSKVPETTQRDPSCANGTLIGVVPRPAIDFTSGRLRVASVELRGL